MVTVLKAEFRMNEDQAHNVMMTAHRRGVCVVAVYARDIAETKATRATDAGRAKGYPLLFTTEPEEGRRVEFFPRPFNMSLDSMFFASPPKIC